MAKIKIKGCGYCSKSKGCKIKKSFRDLALKQEPYKIYKYLGWNGEVCKSTIDNEFELNCPFCDRKYNTGDKVTFTLGIKRYIKKTLWDCDKDCDYCNGDPCDAGVVTFTNTRYKEYIPVSGTISGLMRKDKWVISVDENEYNRIIKLCNDLDIKFFDEITTKMDNGSEFHSIFISKEKYIKHI